MAIYSDLEMERIMNDIELNESFRSKIKNKLNDKNSSTSQKHISNLGDNIADIGSDITNKSKEAISDSIDNFKDHPGETIGDMIGASPVHTVAKTSGKMIDKYLLKKCTKDEENKDAKKILQSKDEHFDFRKVYRTREFNEAMNRYFDITDRETRKILLAVDEADQSKVLTALTTKLYDNIMNRVDCIDFQEIELSKGDFTKLPNYATMIECIENLGKIMIEYKQSTESLDIINTAIANLIDRTPIWTRAYSLNCELPIITYNTIAMAIICSVSYMVTIVVDFIKKPSSDTIDIVIDKSKAKLSSSYVTIKNLKLFNNACDKGEVDKAMNSTMDDYSHNKSNFVGGIGIAAAIAGTTAILVSILPIIRELIFTFYYLRTKVSDYFDVQSQMLQINSYNVQQNKMDVTAQERKQIAAKQLSVANKFKFIADKFRVKYSTSEKKAIQDVKVEDSKKYKADEIMDEMPDSASALF